MTASCSELNPVASPRLESDHRIGAQLPAGAGAHCADQSRSVALPVCASRSKGGNLSSVLSSTRRCFTNPDPDAEVGASPGGVIGAAGVATKGWGRCGYDPLPSGPRLPSTNSRFASFGTPTTVHQLQIRLLRDRAAGNAAIASRSRSRRSPMFSRYPTPPRSPSSRARSQASRRKPYIATACRRCRPRNRILGRAPWPGPHGKFVLNFLAGSQHSLLGHQLSLAFLQRLGAGFGRHRAAL